jgi:tetratricopeptide (TPR) repeat protein/tRNA A-37 threonylcarbamoyl transferase component Bud32
MSVEDLTTRLQAALQSRYHVERELGRGGMANVYLAHDLRHQRKVALKVLKPELAEVVGGQRFLAEIKTTANLQHPHILPLFDSGEAGGFLFYVMPFVEGESLRDRLDREAPLPIEEALRIATLVGGALQYAHDRKVIHRDIKPANVMLSGDLPMVADFGIALALENAGDARLTATNVSLGSPQYASPEQATGDGVVDERSDLYALACVLYEVLTGEPPHAAKTPGAIVAKKLTVAPVPIRALRATVPAHVERAVMKGLAVVPADRFSSMAAFVEALGDATVQAPAPRLAAVAPPTAVASSATAFVGREKERAALMMRLDALADGRGSLVLLGGEPGVGKTRLAEFVLEEARRRGYMCVVGHSYELEGTPPFTPFIEQVEYTARIVPPETFRAILGDAAPEIARMMPALKRQFTDIESSIELPLDQFRHYLFHRYSEFVQRAAQAAPIVVLFDDLHWADEGSLLLLERLARQLHGIPMLALGTYRDVELDVGRPLAASLERLSRQHNIHRMAVKRLPETEVRELLEVLGGSPPPQALVETIYHETEGNPFFVQEVFRHLKEEGRLFDEQGAWRADLDVEELAVPEGVRLVVGRRLARVSESCRSVLVTASVIGPRFALAVLEATGIVEEEALLDALEEAEAAQLIQSIKGSRDPLYAFTHELIRQTLLDTISIPRRQRRHLKIAAALKEAYGNRLEEHAPDMAYHLYQAGAAADLEETLHFLCLAGDLALAGSGFEEALAQYERALSLEEDVPERLIAAALEGKANALDGMGRWVEVTEVAERALRLYESTGDTEGIGRLAHLVCLRLNWRARNREAAEIGLRALEALSSTPSAHRSKVRSDVATALDLMNEPGSRELIEEALAEARESGDHSAIRRAQAARREWDYHHGRFADACAVEQDPSDASGPAERISRGGMDALWIWALILPLLGRLEEAAEFIRRAREVGRERKDVGAALCAEFGHVTVTAMRTADGRRVEALAREVAEGFREVGGWSQGGLVWAGLGLLWQGDAEGAARLMDVGSDGIREPRLWSSLSAGWRFRTAAYAGVPDARSLFDAVEPRIFRAGRRPYPGDGFGLHAAIEGLAVLGDVEGAGSLYPDAVESLALGTLGHMDGLWACTTGIAAACQGQWEAAERHFAIALEQAERIPHVMAQSDARRWWAWMLLRRSGAGDRDRAVTLLEEAIARYRVLEAGFFGKIATEMLVQARG